MAQQVYQKQGHTQHKNQVSKLLISTCKITRQSNTGYGMLGYTQMQFIQCKSPKLKRKSGIYLGMDIGNKEHQTRSRGQTILVEGEDPVPGLKFKYV